MRCAANFVGGNAFEPSFQAVIRWCCDSMQLTVPSLRKGFTVRSRKAGVGLVKGFGRVLRGERNPGTTSCAGMGATTSAGCRPRISKRRFKAGRVELCFVTGALRPSAFGRGLESASGRGQGSGGPAVDPIWRGSLQAIALGSLWARLCGRGIATF